MSVLEKYASININRLKTTEKTVKISSSSNIIFLSIKKPMEYKFILDNQNIEESFEAGLECTNTTDVYTNRSVNIDSAVVLSTVCFNSCSTCE